MTARRIADALRAEGYLTVEEAAERCGLEAEYFRRLCYRQRGPTKTRPSRNVMLFKREHVDAWKESWLLGR